MRKIWKHGYRVDGFVRLFSLRSDACQVQQSVFNNKNHVTHQTERNIQEQQLPSGAVYPS